MTLKAMTIMYVVTVLLLFNSAAPNAVKLTDLEEKCLSIWAYVIKHRLTTLALNDALTLFPLLSGVDTTKIKLKDIFGNT